MIPCESVSYQGGFDPQLRTTGLESCLPLTLLFLVGEGSGGDNARQGQDLTGKAAMTGQEVRCLPGSLLHLSFERSLTEPETCHFP